LFWIRDKEKDMPRIKVELISAKEMVERPWAERNHYLRLNQTRASYFLILKRFDSHNKMVQDQAYPLQPTVGHSTHSRGGQRSQAQHSV